MSLREHVVLASLIACIAGGALLKGMRYTATPDAAGIDTAGRIARFLVDRGWQPAAAFSVTNETAYASLTFEKTGCESMLSVAMLGNSTELEHLVRTNLGHDIAFVQEGQVLLRPDPLGQRIELVKVAVGSLLGLTSNHAMPILAVSPAPRNAHESCSPPPAAEWQRLRG
jgi:hypothetical protein